MADVIVKVLDPADEMSFLSLREAKLLLGLPLTAAPDPIEDERLELQIAIASAQIMRLCNRMMARQRVVETWRDFAASKLFLRTFPVAEDDIEQIMVGGGILGPDDYELEEESGTLQGLGRFAAPVRITYSGGYDLPDDAPLDLKQACALLVREQRKEATRESIEGIRMIAHKESRVIFFDPNASAAKTTGGQASALPAGVEPLLSRYTRFWA
jgi:hypothetical protein